MESLKHGSANSIALGVAAGLAPPHRPLLGAGKRRALLTKDLDLVGDLAARKGADAAPLREVADRWLSLVTPLSET